MRVRAVAGATAGARRSRGSGLVYLESCRTDTSLAVILLRKTNVIGGMDQNRVSGVTPISDRDHSLRELIDRNQFDGLAIVLLGITQVLLATVSLM